MTRDQTEALRSQIIKVVALAYLDGKSAGGKPDVTGRALEDQMLATLGEETYRQMDGLMDLISHIAGGTKLKKPLVN